MEIRIQKLTDAELMQSACSFTSGKASNASLASMYKAEHSPVRTQLFWVEMIGIPTFVSVHFVRHKVGVEHYVKSNRDDRGGDGNADRNTPVNHAMLINAQALINMSHSRLCRKAHPRTIQVMEGIRDAVHLVDEDLARCMVPKCVYRNGACGEPQSCGCYKYIKTIPRNNF